MTDSRRDAGGVRLGAPVGAHGGASRGALVVSGPLGDRASPLVTLSQSLRDARRNADTILLTAHSNATRNAKQLQQQLEGLGREAEAKLAVIKSQAASSIKLGSGAGLEDWDLLKKLAASPAPQRRVTPRSASASNLERLSQQLIRSERRPLAGTTAPIGPRTALGRPRRQSSEGVAPDFSAAVSPLLQPSHSAASLHEQAKQLAEEEAARSVEAVAQTLLAGPRNALATAQATLDNCTHNLATLGTFVSRNLAVSRVLSAPRLGGGPSSGSDSDESGNASPGRPLALSWLSLPGYVQPRDIELRATGATDEQAVGEDLLIDGLDEMLEGRQLGPFQRQAVKRRRRKGRSCLREPGRQVAIVTTAALPWMTGTSVNPLLRAAYLAKDSSRQVTLVIPWLAKSDQRIVFPNNITFETPEQQEAYVREWVNKRTGFESSFKVTFYPGRYAAEKCSILPVGDPTQCIPDAEADVAVLEEPEHLTWYHHGRRWTDKFNHVVGVIHTNYLDYARREEGGAVKEALLKHVNEAMCRAHCHKVVKLSDAVQPLPRQVTEFVHGVPQPYLEVGAKKAAAPADGAPRFGKGAYFLGKVLWAKGYQELLDLVASHTQRNAAKPLRVDCYGAGDDLHTVVDSAQARRLDLEFHGARDHLHESLHDYKVFINPSTSDVVATTTAEALAMGKWVVCADLPCNAFFSSFPNCLTYKTPEEFSEKVSFALEHDPAPLAPDIMRRLTWEDATDRFLSVASLEEAERPKGLESLVDTAIWATHNTLCGVEALRVGAGAGANTRDAPPSLLDYEPSTANVGGFFDDKKRAKTTFSKAQEMAASQTAAARS